MPSSIRVRVLVFLQQKMYRLEDVNAKSDAEGLFVYRARRALYVRRLPAITDDTRTPKVFSKNELVAVDNIV